MEKYKAEEKNKAEQITGVPGRERNSAQFGQNWPHCEDHV